MPHTRSPDESGDRDVLKDALHGGCTGPHVPIPSADNTAAFLFKTT
jgi:hypothetical protein